MKYGNTTDETKNARTKQYKLPNVICKEDTDKTADTGNHCKNENCNQIFNNCRIHNIPPKYFRNYFILSYSY